METYENWREEKRSAYLYGIMAQYEKNILHKKLFLDLKTAAEKQAGIWENKIKELHQPLPTKFNPDLRVRIVSGLIAFVGTERIHFILSAMKIRGMSVYSNYHSEHRHTSLGTASNCAPRCLASMMDLFPTSV